MNKGAVLAADASRPPPQRGCRVGDPGPGFVARRLHTPGLRAPRASPGGRLDVQTRHPFIHERVLSDAYAEPNDKGRTGQVPAGCAFRIKGSSSACATTAPDHANCSVGSFTHGFLTLEEAASKDDVCAVPHPTIRGRQGRGRVGEVMEPAVLPRGGYA